MFLLRFSLLDMLSQIYFGYGHDYLAFTHKKCLEIFTRGADFAMNGEKDNDSKCLAHKICNNDPIGEATLTRKSIKMFASLQCRRSFHSFTCRCLDYLPLWTFLFQPKNTQNTIELSNGSEKTLRMIR